MILTAAGWRISIRRSRSCLLYTSIAELVRGKTGRVYGALNALLTTMKGIPLAYNKDMQEDKEWAFDAIDTAKGCLTLFAGMLRSMQCNKARMKDSARPVSYTHLDVYKRQA